MPENISRRSFIATALSGAGSAAFSSEISPFIPVSNASFPGSNNKKKLIATPDYSVNIGQCIFEKNHLDDMHRYLASIGVTRHHWIYEPPWDHYGIYTNDFDLMAEAVKSA